MVNLVCWIGIALDYYNDKILNIGVHLILLFLLLDLFLLEDKILMKKTYRCNPIKI